MGSSTHLQGAARRSRRRQRLLAAVVAITAVVVGAVAGPAVAAVAPAGLMPAVVPAAVDGWSGPKGLTKTDYYFERMQGAVANDGTAVVAFSKGNDREVYTRVRSGATRTWGERELLTRSANGPPLTATRDGAVAAVWIDEDLTHPLTQLMIRRYGPDGWGAARGVPVEGPSTSVVDVDMNARGDVAVVLQLVDDSVGVAVAPVRGPWKVEPLVSKGVRYQAARVLLSDEGQLTVVETDSPSGPLPDAIDVARLDGAGAWTTTELGPPDKIRVSDVAAEVGPLGTVAVLWTESNGASQVVLQVADPGGMFGPRRVLAGSDQRDCFYPDSCADVGFAPGDRLVVAWSIGGPGAGVLVADRSSDGAWSDPVAVPLEEPASEVVDLAVNQDGSFVIKALSEFASCPTLTTCTSVGAPDPWPIWYHQYGWVAAGPGGSVNLLYGERLCQGRCFGRPYWSAWHAR